MLNAKYSDTQIKCSVLVVIIVICSVERKVLDFDFVLASLTVWIRYLIISRKGNDPSFG